MHTKEHWERIYNTKKMTDVSWYQPNPIISLDFINELQISKDAAIIDVGAGDGVFVDILLTLGYTNITILDISEAAIKRAKDRLGNQANKINWVVSDIADYEPDRQFDFWHDRAVFHFFTTKKQINKYIQKAKKSISKNGKIVIGTFSEDGPAICSGLPIKQYTENTLTSLIHQWFKKIKCITADHITPSNSIQNFLFCSFQKKNNGHS